MNVDFNNARLQLANAYHRLCLNLNSAIGEDGNIVIPVDDLQDQMDELRQLALMPCHIYEDNNPNFLCLSDKVTHVAHFNPEENEG